MAIMIPDTPREYDPLSFEGLIFDSLKALPDSYFVVHSLTTSYVKDGTMHYGETDFVIFNPALGILCIEAKGGNVQYSNGRWLYSSRVEMKHSGPYKQAELHKWNILDLLEKSSLKDLKNRCKVMHAVWFPSIDRNYLDSIDYPTIFDKDITFTKEDLINPLEHINKIFEYRLSPDIKTNLSELDTKRILREIICPEFNLFPSSSINIDLKNIVFNRLLSEQSNILNYLVEQRTAVINGAAGTGKTMIAVEKATRHSMNEEKVLFLCYNSYLKDSLKNKYATENIDFMTIDGLACKLCNSSVANYKEAGNELTDMFINEQFPYKHIIIDEGQDFGKDEIEESGLLELLYDLVISDTNEINTFYVFYDSLQLVQSTKLPKFISEADCKLTLYKNCRNTASIATTSLSPISDRLPKLYEGSVVGVTPTIHFRNTAEEVLAKIAELKNQLTTSGVTNIVILTCKTEMTSLLTNYIEENCIDGLPFTTCRKFKGLEADAVILVDFDSEAFTNNSMMYYVGTSRAKMYLDIITIIDDEECISILKNNLHSSKKIKVPKQSLAWTLKTYASLM